MKKNILFFGVICSVAFIGCKWRIPEKVSVKNKGRIQLFGWNCRKRLIKLFFTKRCFGFIF